MLVRATTTSPAWLVKKRNAAIGRKEQLNMWNLINLVRRNRRQYVHINSRGEKFWLYYTDVTLRGHDRPHRMYFFRRRPGEGIGHPSRLPRNRKVKENPRNGFVTVWKAKS